MKTESQGFPDIFREYIYKETNVMKWIYEKNLKKDVILVSVNVNGVTSVC